MTSTDQSSKQDKTIEVKDASLLNANEASKDDIADLIKQTRKKNKVKDDKIYRGVIINTDTTMNSFSCEGREALTNKLKEVLKDHQLTTQFYDNVQFDIYFDKPKMKASQIMAMRRSGRVPEKAGKNTNMIASMLARQVLDGQVVAISDYDMKESDPQKMMMLIANAVRKDIKGFERVMNDPRTKEFFESMIGCQTRKKKIVRV